MDFVDLEQFHWRHSKGAAAFPSPLLLHIIPPVQLWWFTVALFLSVVVPRETSFYKHAGAILSKHILFCFPALQQNVCCQLLHFS